MGNKKIDESANVLFKRAEEDVCNVNALLKDRDVPEEYNYRHICYNITQAVEKFLKGYIVNNDTEVNMSHDLDYVCNVAMSVHNDFKKLKRECILLNNYVPGIRYNDRFNIEKHEVNEVLKSLNKIYNFPQIAVLREEFAKQEDYRRIPEFDFIKISDEQKIAISEYKKSQENNFKFNKDECYDRKLSN